MGVDIAGEERFPLREEFVAGFKRVRESGMSITIHAGESGPADNVKQVRPINGTILLLLQIDVIGGGVVSEALIRISFMLGT